MNQIIKILLFVMILSAFSMQSEAMMTKVEYDSIVIGAPASHVKELAGKPYRVISEKDGSKSLQYIERFEIGPGTIDQRTYTLRIKDDVVIDKTYSSKGGGMNIQLR